MPDQMRGDCMGCAGHPMVETPHVDGLAREGARFSRACTVSPLCMPARASFISGLYPHNHGMWHNAGQLPPHDETFFQSLQAAGYRTAHIGKSHYYPHTQGLHLRDREDYMRARGFDYLHETTGPWATVTTDSYMTDDWQSKGLLEAFRRDYEKRRKTGPCAVWPSPLPVDEFPDSYVGRKAVEWVDSCDADGPTCTFVGFGGPHEPWDAPGDYATKYDPDETPPPIPVPEAPAWLPEVVVERIDKKCIRGMTGDDIAKIRGNYYGKISLIDHWVGEILAAYERRGWLDNTLVVLWSDHGEMLGDHGRLHKSNFHESALRIPMILRWPGHVPAGMVSDALVETVDIFPTILDAAGQPPSKRCFGRSLWPALRGETQAVRDAVFSEVDHVSMVRTEHCKYAVTSDAHPIMLYDLAADPHEQVNLVDKPDAAELEAEMQDRLLDWLLKTQVRL